MNRKGFTLIELLGVIVILVTILLVAIPSVSSTLERKKIKDNELKKQSIISASEIFASNNKNSTHFDYSNYLNNNCGISTNDLYKNNLVSEDEYNAFKGYYVLRDGTIVENIESCYK